MSKSAGEAVSPTFRGRREAWHYNAIEGRPQWSKAFPTWKFKAIAAMGSDARLLASDFRIGVALLQHLGSAAGPVFPSQETLAELTHMTPRNVHNCLERLRVAGWIRWVRGNRQLANDYEFDVEAIDEQIKRAKADERERKSRRAGRRKARSDMKPVSSQNPPLTGSRLQVATGNRFHTNNLIEEADLPDAVPRARKGSA
jgi:hypothetical protein